LAITETERVPGFVHNGPELYLAADQVDAFRTATEYLNQTESFRSAQFMRFYRLTDRETGQEVRIASGEFRLQERSDYELQLLQMQPRDVVSRTQFRVGSAEELVEVIGGNDFDIASRYDLIRIPLHVPQLAAGDRQTILVVEPKVSEVRGPKIRLRVRIARQPNTTTAAGAAVLLMLAGLPGALPSLLKAAIVLFGALSAFVLFYYGWVRIPSPRA
jgi:hypothetical protein